MSYVNIGKVTEQLNEIEATVEAKVSKGHEVIEFQAPTTENNYTWYRKYADGWIEQGGYIAASTSTSQINNLVVPMANANYTINITAVSSSWTGGLNSVFDRTTTSFKMWTSDDSTFNSIPVIWEVKGMYAQ